MSRAQYTECSTFTAVYTPHFIDAILSRRALLPEPIEYPNGNPFSLIHNMLERLWAVGIEDKCVGFQFGQGYVYYKCKWNVGRNRWELELISFTPNKQFHTRELRFAEEVYP
jgi:hypothetical protein